MQLIVPLLTDDHYICTMMHMIPLVLVLFLLDSSQKVFICTGHKSEIYHKTTDCRWTKKSLVDAKDMHRGRVVL